MTTTDTPAPASSPLADAIRDMALRARDASRVLATLSARQKNDVLADMADAIAAARPSVLAANARDLDAARAAGLSDAMLDRLLLTPDRLDAIISAVRNLRDLPDPIGKKLSRWVRPNGLVISKIRVPLGVIGMIYEARPNVTVDAAALCFKTSNAAILRCGREAMNTSQALVEALHAALARHDLPPDAIQLITTLDYDAIAHLVQLEGLVDLVIPRGGEALIRSVTRLARVPVIKHYKGVCHIYVHPDADLSQAVSIIQNAKCSRPGVCNACEKVLVHKDIAPQFLPLLAKTLRAGHVQLRGDPATCAILPDAVPATDADWDAEYLDLILAIAVVPSLQAAIDHINLHSSHHSDAILATDPDAISAFTAQIDSACVYANASTRFTDGGEFGMGAEIGISTDKLHARGPMGLEELTTYKYVIIGDGQIR
jgi:glutamate-5-semialdehyde dehydrogenase